MSRYRVINKQTGEYIDTEYDSVEELRDRYEDLEAQIASLKKLQEKIKNDIKEFMGDETEFDLGKGYKFKKVISEYKNYDPEVMWDWLTTEEFKRLVKPDKKAVDEYLSEHMDDEGRWKQVNQHLRSSMTIDRVQESLRFVKPDDVINRQRRVKK